MPARADPSLLRALAVELKARRAALGLSQEELAWRAQINRTFVAKIERAANQPSISVLFQLAAGLDLKASELVASIEKRHRKELRAQAPA
jgi:transcriptional regulator with XRE-family HTH domain